MCWSLIDGLTLGVRDWGWFRREQWGTCVRKSVYRRQRKAGMGGYLLMGLFILALDPFNGLTSNFFCPYNLLFG
jgi:hypothetical protein